MRKMKNPTNISIEKVFRMPTENHTKVYDYSDL